MRRKDFVVDNGIYKQDKITFFRTERTSQRRNIGNGKSHLFTCNMANEYFVSNGAQAIIPICHPCSTFACDAKLKPSLSEKKKTIARQDCETISVPVVTEKVCTFTICRTQYSS